MPQPRDDGKIARLPADHQKRQLQGVGSTRIKNKTDRTGVGAGTKESKNKRNERSNKVFNKPGDDPPLSCRGCLFEGSLSIFEGALGIVEVSLMMVTGDPA